MWSYVQYRRLGRDVAKETNPDEKDPAPDANPCRGPGREPPAKRTDSSQSGHRDPSPAPTDERDSGLIVVRTSGEDDPLDPRNWPLASRSKNIAVLGLLIFTQTWAGAAASMANTAASADFGVSKVAENAYTAIYLFGIGTGALVAGPLSETVGRNPTFLGATFFYMLFVLGSALTPTYAGQVVCRYFVGFFASATLAINGSSAGDQFRPVKRALVFPVIAWANVAAPVIAPIVGGWIVSHPNLTWRWTEWITLIISAFAFLVALLFLPETYLPLLLDWKAKHLRAATGDERYTSEFAQKESFLKRLRKIGPMPATFLGTEPVITVLGLYLTLLYSLLFSSLSGFDYIFKETYKLDVATTGSCFGAIAAGATAFTIMAPGFYSWARHHTDHVRGRPVEPEFRLWPAIIAAPLLPAALFWLGWTNRPTISIWSGLGACFVFGAVLIAIYVSSYEYIIDSYGEHAAIALASITMVRYLVAGGVVMAARPMYEKLGVSWTMTLLGCFATVLAPAPLLFYMYGKKLRKRSPYAKGSDDDS